MITKSVFSVNSHHTRYTATRYPHCCTHARRTLISHPVLCQCRVTLWCIALPSPTPTGCTHRMCMHMCTCTCTCHMCMHMCMCMCMSHVHVHVRARNMRMSNYPNVCVLNSGNSTPNAHALYILAAPPYIYIYKSIGPRLRNQGVEGV